MNRKTDAIILAVCFTALSGFLFACFTIIVPALEGFSNYAARLLRGVCILATIGLPGMLYYLAIHCREIYRRQQKTNEIKKSPAERTRARNFGLLLRSSFSDLNYPSERMVVNEKWSSFGPQKQTQIIPGFYRQLEKIASPTDLRAIKNPDLTGDIPTVTYLDEMWQADIIADFFNSSFIVLIPTWMSGSVRWEIEAIKKLGLLKKVIIAMPAAVDSPNDIDFAWLNAAVALAQMGISIRGYDRFGGILTQSQPMCFQRISPLNMASFPEYD